MITPLRRLLTGAAALITALLVTLVALAAPTSARARPQPDPAGDAAAALRTTAVYVSQAAQAYGARVDLATLSLPSELRVAVLTNDVGNAGKLAADIDSRLSPLIPGALTVGVVVVSSSGINGFDAVSSADYCAGGADLAAQAALHAVPAAQVPDVQRLLRTFVTQLQALPAGQGQSSCAAASNTSDSNSATAWLWLLIAAVVGLVGIGTFALYSKRNSRHHVDAARAEITPLFERLAADVQTLDAGIEPQVRQALTDASQRLRAVRDQLAADGNAADYSQVRHALLEGLTASEFVRSATGVPPGSALPALLDEAHEQLAAPQQVTVQDESFDGAPAYVPGSPYYFGGGGGVPGGWYATPFWRTLLLSGVLTEAYDDADPDRDAEQ